jgi:aromatic ring hydroxylase
LQVDHESLKGGLNSCFLPSCCLLQKRLLITKFISRNPKISADESLKILKFVEDVSTSPMSSWYKTAGVHGGGSPVMETIALNIEYDFEDKKQLARYLAGIQIEPNDTALLKQQPTWSDQQETE